jgi:hypothetical protein
MHSLFLELGLSRSLNVVLFSICNIYNENNTKPSYQIMQVVSEGIFHTLEEPSPVLDYIDTAKRLHLSLNGYGDKGERIFKDWKLLSFYLL